MTNYAVLDSNNKIKNIIYIDQESENMDVFLESQKIIISDDNATLIKIEDHHKFAMIGSIYDGEFFQIPQPYPSWMWDDLIEQWVAPEIHPYELHGNDGIEYIWDEENKRWIQR